VLKSGICFSDPRSSASGLASGFQISVIGVH
jgi:hypothetical protein